MNANFKTAIALTLIITMNACTGQSSESNLPTNAKQDALISPSLKDVKLVGTVGEKMNSFFTERIFSDFAKDSIFGEARDAFRTKIDDVMKAPLGYWQGEFWGKLMISACRVAEYSQNAKLIQFLNEEAHRLLQYQEPDGYLGSYSDKTFVTSPDVNEAEKVVGWKCDYCWNLWNRKYTMWGLLMCYKLTGDKSLLEAVVKSMDQEIRMLDELHLDISETGTFHGMPSSSVLKPLLMLYRETGYERYLDFAKKIVANWDRNGNPIPNLIRNAFSGKPVHTWYPNPELWAKAYEMMSCLDGLLEYYRITADERCLESVRRLQSLLWKYERNPLQSVGYNDKFAHAAEHLNGVTEPCDAIHWIRMNHDLFLITGDPQYIDVIEYTFYNAFLAGVYRNGKWGARAVRSHGRNLTTVGQAELRHSHCCVNNMPRTFMDIAQTLISRDTAGCLYINWYSDSESAMGDAKVSVSGNYPVSDKVTVRIATDKPTKVKFRIPSWSTATTVNGKGASKGWFETEVSGTQMFELAFDMTPQIYDSHCLPIDEYPKNDFRYTRWCENGRDKDIAKLIRTTPAAEIMRGPLLLAKSKLVGDTAEEIFNSETINRNDYHCSLTPLENNTVWGAWQLLLNKDGKTIKVNVCNFSSAADQELEEGADAFSVFF